MDLWTTLSYLSSLVFSIVTFILIVTAMRFVITFNKVLCMYVCMYVCLLYRAQPVKRGSDNLSDLNRYQQKKQKRKNFTVN